ncbi:DUF4097 family beta strand repeat-containing protein [Frankia sp. AgB32]|uniref:DUF4097 family beta strand repeat-containing protein n=1 Tax=Frankia sp. AgB32 TaxID=631119 RepID=UPI00201014CA|nr:DUF4097 family beta strand repeat-containing protein [Frankia sp. AgB32]MCK9894452.1 DUF4097 family beta strand repeat-containing protein [Frankia sp. AgB32]
MSEPAMPEPTMPEPAMSEPAMSEPTMPEPTMSEPAASPPSVSATLDRSSPPAPPGSVGGFGGFPPVDGPGPVRRRPRGRRAVLALGALAVVVFTLCAAIAVIQGTTGREHRVEARAFPASVTHLVVEGTASDVYLYGPGETPAAGISFPAATAGGEPGGIGVVARLGGVLRPPTLSTHVDGDTVRVSRHCRAFWDCTATLYLRVPTGTRVDVDTAGGNVAATGLDGPVRLLSTAGDVEVDRPRGDIEATSSAGDVSIVDSRARRVDVSTSAGDVLVDTEVAPDDVNARSVAGSVEVYLPPGAPPYDADVHTAGGTRDVSIGRDAAAAHRLRAWTVAGNVTVGYRDGS